MAKADKGNFIEIYREKYPPLNTLAALLANTSEELVSSFLIAHYRTDLRCILMFMLALFILFYAWS